MYNFLVSEVKETPDRTGDMWEGDKNLRVADKRDRQDHKRGVDTVFSVYFSIELCLFCKLFNGIY